MAFSTFHSSNSTWRHWADHTSAGRFSTTSCTIAPLQQLPPPHSTSRRISPSLERRQQHSSRPPPDAASLSRRASVQLPKLLAGQIAAADTLEQLHGIVADHGGRCDHRHIARLLTRTAQLATAAGGADVQASLQQQDQDLQQQQHQQQQDQRQEQQHLQLLDSTLANMMAQRARHASPETLLAAVAALGRLAGLLSGPTTSTASHARQEQQQQQQRLQALAARAEELRGQFSVSQAAVLCWGFAKAGLQPQGAWLQHMLQAFMQQYEAAAAAGQQAAAQDHQHHEQQQQQQQPTKPDPMQIDAELLRRRPTLLVSPPLGQKQQQQQQQQQQHRQQQWKKRALPHHHSLATDLALVLYAAALLKGPQQQQQQQQQQLQPLQEAWLVRWQAAVLTQLPRANAQDLAQLLWGLGVLAQNPGGAGWLHAVLAASAERLEGCGPQALANSIWAVERLAQLPQQHQQQQQHQQEKEKELPQQQPPPPQQQQEQQQEQQQGPKPLPAVWVEAFFEAMYTEPGLPSCPQALSCCLASLARLRLAPPDAPRMLALLERSTASLAAASPRQLADLFWACATLSLRPSPAWLKAALTAAATAAGAGRLSPQQLGTLVWALACLQGAGGASSSSPGQGLLGSQRLQVLVLLQALAAAHQGRGLQALGPAGRSSLVWALASLGIVPDRAWLSALLSAAFGAGLASDSLRCAATLFCVASLDFDGLVEWLEGFLEGGRQEPSGGGGGGRGSNADGGGQEPAGGSNGGGGQAGSGGIDLSLQKYAALAGVLGALAEMEPRELRAAWLEQSISPEWTAEAASEGWPGSSMPLPAALAVWVDSLAEPAETGGPEGTTL